jgi:hypothetical protein
MEGAVAPRDYLVPTRYLAWILAGLIVLSFGLFLGAAGSSQRNARLAQDSVVSAVITKAWDVYGKHPMHLASISYTRVQDGKAVSCHVDEIAIGTPGDHRGPGDHIDIAPRQNTCYEPDFPGTESADTAKGAAIAGCVALALAILLGVLCYRRLQPAQPAAT